MVTADPRAARVSWLVLQGINPHLIRKETMMGSMAADTFFKNLSGSVMAAREVRDIERWSRHAKCLVRVQLPSAQNAPFAKW